MSDDRETMLDQTAGAATLEDPAELEASEMTDDGGNVTPRDPEWLGPLENLQYAMWKVSEEHGFHDDLALLHSLAELAQSSATHNGYDQLPQLLDGLYDSQKLKLIHDELSEAHEEARDGRRPDEVYYVCRSCKVETPSFEPTWEPAETDCCDKPDLKPEGVPIEVADAVIRALDFAEIRRFSLARAIELKAAYNAGRPYKHGRRF